MSTEQSRLYKEYQKIILDTSGLSEGSDCRIFRKPFDSDLGWSGDRGDTNYEKYIGIVGTVKEISDNNIVLDVDSDHINVPFYIIVDALKRCRVEGVRDYYYYTEKACRQNNEFKLGDFVNILRKPVQYEIGWRDGASELSLKYIDYTYLDRVESSGYRCLIKQTNGYTQQLWLPFHILEKTKPVTKKITIEGKDLQIRIRDIDNLKKRLIKKDSLS